MTINWHNIRPIHNSLNDGFEEFVCQLASREEVAGSKYFQRIGKPDGGKECYWTLGNGDQHMWQAKYFTASLTTTQWNQINKSVTNAIDNHPNLKKYCICVPVDMPDGKVKGQSSMLDKWKEKVTEWKNYALSKGMQVEFVFWGSAQLIDRLSTKSNEGLTYFWFNKEELTDEWLDIRNKESINALGVRYTKELNFELPIAKVFDGISRNDDLKKQLDKHYQKFLDSFRRIHIKIADSTVQDCLGALKIQIDEFKAIYESCQFTSNDLIPFGVLKDQLKGISNTSWKTIQQISEIGKSDEKRDEITGRTLRLYQSEINDINSFLQSLRSFEQFFDAPTSILANKPYLLITGDAGIGKSHLLADVVEKRKEQGRNSLLLLGENFTNSDMPWSQILQNQLRKLQIDEFVFLGALNAKAESERSRILIFIDAINEGNGRKVWPNRLRSFIQFFENYPWLGLVLSIRSSFEDRIAPTDSIDDELITRVNHYGFSGVEYEAVKRFFLYFKIQQPTTPFLNPEFQNPLFLKLFCKSLAERGLHEIPEGYEGITSVINYFLDSINIKLSRPTELDYDKKRHLVKNTVDDLIKVMINSGKDYVDYIQAEEIALDNFDRYCTNKEPFLLRLISEGVLTDDVRWDSNGEDYDVVYFAYQRFQDHLIVSALLDTYLDSKNPKEAFQKGKLHDIIKDSNSIYYHQNLIEALSIQLPERTGLELSDVHSSLKDNEQIATAFIKSLIWRKNQKFSEEVLQYVEDTIVPDYDLFSEFLEVVILSSMKSDFYFNANSLHGFLSKLTLPERDDIWTTWLQNKYVLDGGYYSAVKRLIDFSWNIEDKHEIIEDDSLLLGCITMGWFFTSANRYLRDAATKGLVCLLQYRIQIIPALLQKFKDVNDPYVLERLYASAYGAVLRTPQVEKLESLSEYIYQNIFDKREVYPHILLRDYARGIIEYTIYLKHTPKINIQKVRPPYKSKQLPKKFPSNTTIDKKYKPKGNSGNYGGNNWGATAILNSMVTEYGRGTARYGDFGRYVFQRAFDDWNVDYDGLSNYAIQRIFELGYDPELFSEFDSEQGTGRGSGHKERIGKKYQWIVFYELLARVSDHCQLFDESSWDRPKKTMSYEGPWHPYVRDIDPTILIKETLGEQYGDKHTPHWWFSYNYSPWTNEDRDWIVDKKDIPIPQDIIEVKDSDGTSWLWLEIHPEWGEPKPLGEDSWISQTKRLWYQIRSYLVKKQDTPKLKKTLSKDFHRGELPEARSLYTIFDREYYWSYAFDFFNKPYYSGEDWIEIIDNKTDKLVTVIHRAAEWFNWEEEYDCSKTTPIQFFKPTKIIQEGLNLWFSDKEGTLCDNDNQIICFDPSVRHQSVSGLLVKKDELLSFLEKEDLVLVWTIIGEKQFLGNFRGQLGHPSRLNISGLYSLEQGKIKGKLHFEEE